MILSQYVYQLTCFDLCQDLVGPVEALGIVLGDSTVPKIWRGSYGRCDFGPVRKLGENIYLEAHVDTHSKDCDRSKPPAFLINIHSDTLA